MAELRGSARLRAALRDLKKAGRDPKAVQESAEYVQRMTQRLVYVDEGDLRRNVRVVPPTSGLRHRGIARDVGWINVNHAWLQEYGTRYHRANPALTVALEMSAQRLSSNVADQIRDAVR